MGKFGSSYPPGCSGTPDDDFRDPDPRVEKIREILDSVEAELLDGIIDEVCRLAEAISNDLEYAENRECPTCLERMFDLDDD